MFCVHTVFLACSWEMMNVPWVLIRSVSLELLVHMMWYKASISRETVCGSFVSSTYRDIFNVTTYDTISPLRYHEMSATCRADMSDTSAMRRIICRFGTNGRHVVRWHCQLSAFVPSHTVKAFVELEKCIGISSFIWHSVFTFKSVRGKAQIQ